MEPNYGCARKPRTGAELGTTGSPRNLLTTYTYSPLGNLTDVQQAGTASETARTRHFTYDSLSRLITSQNPETGIVCYGVWSNGSCVNGYDANGNLLQKTDARGMTVGLDYDVLNRPWRKYSTDGAFYYTYYYDNNCYGSNAIGRLTCVANADTGSAFSYDAMGRIQSTLFHGPSESWQAGIQAKYDLAGNLTNLTYPDGRQVTQSFDSAGRLAKVSSPAQVGAVAFDYMAGATPGTGISYTPGGGVLADGLGNGATQTFAYNTRQQMCQIKAAMGLGQPILDRRYFFGNTGTLCGALSSNNGNIFSMVDGLSNVAEGYGYDSLNRLSSASRSDGSYNQSYNLDSFGNMLPVNNGFGLHPNWSITANNQMQLNATGYTYDAAGNLIRTGSPADQSGHAFTFNAQSQVVAVDGGQTATYGYYGSGERAYKKVGADWTDYIYAGGQPMSEHSVSGLWTDYIYANGKKIAMAASADTAIHLHGSNCSSCGTPASAWDLAFGNYTIKPGDRVSWRQYQGGVGRGGFALRFTDGTYTNWVTRDTDGEVMNNDSIQGRWHQRTVDLSSFAGKTCDVSFIMSEGTTGPGVWDEWFADMALYSVDGTVVSIYNRSATFATGFFGGAGVANLIGVVDTSTVPPGSPMNRTLFYLGDHLGTAQIELGSGGWPIWKGQFMPFGGEIDTQATSNHYKFTGKERDTESGLDYFGARYYASNMGRWMSPDPKAPSRKTLFNPQKWNKYNYVLNNPLSNIDPDGLEEITIQLRAYIPQANVGPYRGDNRGPTASQNVTSRTSITLRIETDPKISANPLLSNSGGQAGMTHNDLTGNTATQTQGLPNAQVSRDANGNVVINVKQDVANPLAPSPGIKSDVTIGVPVSGSSVTTSGTVSGSPAFEMNVGTPGNDTTNVPLQGAPSNPVAFAVGLYQPNQLPQTTTPLPPPRCTSGQAGCSQ